MIPYIYTSFSLLFVVAFLWGIKLMNSPGTAVKGNILSALSMFGAIMLTLISNGIITHGFLWLSMTAGGIIGYLLAIKITMVQMPQLVALLNGSGGGASALTALMVLNNSFNSSNTTMVAGGLAMSVGCITFSGSMVAAAKLDNKINQKPVFVRGHTFISVVSILLAMGLIVLLLTDAGKFVELLSIFIIINAFFWGVLFAIRIGGADMPITISLLNSFSGLAGSIAGFTINNPLLVAVGAIVGSSGLILTRAMCHAMNRTLYEVITGKTVSDSNRAATPPAIVKRRTGADFSPTNSPGGEDDQKLFITPGQILKEAKKIVIVPGYGMALSQAQGQVKQLFERLKKQGKEVKFGIHPVAGRMPGHMYVLLTEVNVPYDKLSEMKDINPEFDKTDVVVVIGANDVVNPAANTAVGTPIYGMPILHISESKHIIICNLDTKPGYAGVENPLYNRGNVTLLLGDANRTINRMIAQLED